MYRAIEVCSGNKRGMALLWMLRVGYPAEYALGVASHGMWLEYDEHETAGRKWVSIRWIDGDEYTSRYDGYNNSITIFEEENGMYVEEQCPRFPWGYREKVFDVSQNYFR